MTMLKSDIIIAKAITIFEGKNPLMKIEFPEKGNGSIWDSTRGQKFRQIEQRLADFSVEKGVCFSRRWEPETKPATIYIRAEGKLTPSRDNVTPEAPLLYIIEEFSRVAYEEDIFASVLEAISVVLSEGEEVDRNSVKDIHLKPEFRKGFSVSPKSPFVAAYTQFQVGR
jgi:hypothetical protein